MQLCKRLRPTRKIPSVICGLSYSTGHPAGSTGATLVAPIARSGPKSPLDGSSAMLHGDGTRSYQELSPNEASAAELSAMISQLARTDE